MRAAVTSRALPLPRTSDLWPLAVLLALAALAWISTADRMTGMDTGPGAELGGLAWFAGIWLTMMAAMMLPSLAPMALTCARASAGTASVGRARAAGATLLFAAGFLLPWLVAGLGAYALVEAVRSLALGFLAWDEAGRYIAGGVIVGAALYELTPAKASCLRHCRDRRRLVEDLHPGPFGALRSGIANGTYCVGCCWALMAALFALGVMSITWMIVIAAVIAAEKLLPRSTRVSFGVAALLALLGVLVAFAPDAVPGLTIPASDQMSGPNQMMGAM